MANTHLKTKSQINKMCLVCGKEYFVYPYRKDVAKYCSHKCYSTTICKQKKSDYWYEVMHNKVPWNKGIILNQEHRNKLSDGQKKRFKTGNAWNKGLKGFRAGENSHLWKCGITPESRMERIRFRNELQKKVFTRDDYTCQKCKVRGGYLQVDHIKSWADYKELRFELSNLQTLCMNCHYKKTFKREMPRNVKVWGHNLNLSL